MFNKIFVLFCITISLWACNKENANYTARITTINASPDAIGFDIRIAGTDLDATMNYAEISDYISFPARTDSIQWKLKGSTSYDTSFIGDLPNGNDYSLLFFDSAKKYQSYFFRDNWQQAASDTKAYIRFFPLLVGADSIAVTRFVTDSTQTNLSGVRQFADFVKSSAGANFSTVDTFSRKIWLYNRSKKLDSINIQTLTPGKSYTVYIVGVLGNATTRKPKMIVHEHQ